MAVGVLLTQARMHARTHAHAHAHAHACAWRAGGRAGGRSSFSRFSPFRLAGLLAHRRPRAKKQAYLDAEGTDAKTSTGHRLWPIVMAYIFMAYIVMAYVVMA